jgi:hypothetical protein
MQFELPIAATETLPVYSSTRSYSLLSPHLNFGTTDVISHSEMLQTQQPMPRHFQPPPTSNPFPSAGTEAKSQRKKNGGHVRRQNRSCDQCRKGKRRCDAAVLRDREDGTQYEDHDWEFDGTSTNPSCPISNLLDLHVLPRSQPPEQ